MKQVAAGASHIIALLCALRGPGESYSDVIVRLAQDEAGWRCGRVGAS